MLRRRLMQSGGLKAIDLGLPSGTKWGNMNVGAKSIYDPGKYYPWAMGAQEWNSSIPLESDYRYPLDVEHDTAAQVCGGNWRMPSRDEVQELIDNCTFEYSMEKNGIHFAKFTSNINGNSIIIPYSGVHNPDDDDTMYSMYSITYNFRAYIWTNELATDLVWHDGRSPEYTRIWTVENSGIDNNINSSRNWGLVIRPVVPPTGYSALRP